MNKKTAYLILAIIIVIILICLGIMIFSGNKPANQPVSTTFDPLNATYSIEGQPVTLVNGNASTPAAPGSASQVVTSVFGSPTIGDLNSDGQPDAALILVQNSGGSGTFYYVVAAINSVNGAKGTNGILLGDRIAPQNVVINNGEITANYADRAPTDPMTAAPSVGVSKYMIYNGTALQEVSSTTP